MLHSWHHQRQMLHQSKAIFWESGKKCNKIPWMQAICELLVLDIKTSLVNPAEAVGDGVCQWIRVTTGDTAIPPVSYHAN